MRVTLSPCPRVVWTTRELQRWAHRAHCVDIKPGHTLMLCWPEGLSGPPPIFTLRWNSLPDAWATLPSWAGAQLLAEARAAVEAAQQRQQASTAVYVLSSWIATSSIHGYAVEHFRGTQTECEARRAIMGHPESLSITTALPPSR